MVTVDWKQTRNMKNALSFAIVLGALLACVHLRAAENAEPSKFNGPGSCSSPSCHGGVQARDQTTVLQNEYSTWVVRDKHAHAFVNLTNPVGVRIAKIMGLPSPDTAPRCLACHALDVPAEERARTFDIPTGWAAKTATARRRRGWVRIPRADGTTTSRSSSACTIRAT